jgi:hypothetical protein
VSARPVVEELAEVRAREKLLLATSCASCGHRYSTHAYPSMQGRCAAADPRSAICRCKRFVDPVEVLTP